MKIAKLPIFGLKTQELKTLTLLGGQVLFTVISFPIGIIVARSVHPTSYGQYATAMAFVNLFAGFYLLGLEPIIVRETAKHESQTTKILSNSVILSLLLSTGIIILIFILAILVGYPSVIRKLILLLTIDVALISLIKMFRSSFRGLQMMHMDATLLVAQSVLALLAVLAVLGGGKKQVVWFLLAMVLSRLLMLLISFTGFRDLRFDITDVTPDFSKALLLMSVPIGMAGIVSGFYQRLDTVMISYWMQPEEVGYYNIAYVISFTWLPFSLSLARSIFPDLTSSYYQNKLHEFQSLFRKGMIYSSSAGIGIGIMISMASYIIVDLLYGEQYIQAGGVLRVLAVTIIFQFVNTFLINVMVAIGRQEEYLRASIVGIVIMLVSGIFFIPCWGMYGAALAVIVRETFIFGYFFVGLIRYKVIELSK